MIVRCLQTGRHQRENVEIARVADARIASGIHQRLELRIHRALGIRTFDDRLHHQLRAGDRVVQRRDAAHRMRQALAVPGRIHLARLGERCQRGRHQPRRAFQRFGVAVGQPHAVPAQREHQRQRMAHQASADDGNFGHAGLRGIAGKSIAEIIVQRHHARRATHASRPSGRIRQHIARAADARPLEHREHDVIDIGRRRTGEERLLGQRALQRCRRPATAPAAPHRGRRCTVPASCQAGSPASAEIGAVAGIDAADEVSIDLRPHGAAQHAKQYASQANRV